MFISYAQNFEDVILHRALKHIEGGFYIDIGAQDATIDSVSRGFYELGWRGVHVEPVPAYAEKLRQNRPGETVLEVAVARSCGRLSFFHIPDSGISTGELALAHEHRAAGFDVRLIEVEARPLSGILDANADREIHWLKIDVEGMEGQVIDSWRPSNVRPWIVVIEATRPGTTEPAHSAWESKICGLGYDFVYFDGLNRFYVSERHRELKSAFSAGPNCFDDFALATTNRMSCIPARELEQAQAGLETHRTQLAQAHETNASLKTEQAQLGYDLAHLRTQLAKKTAEAAELEASRNALRALSTQTETKLQADLTASRVNWMIETPHEPVACQAKIRYRHEAAPARVMPLADGEVRVEFETPQSAITPGQAVVFYDGDRVLGGAWIDAAYSPAFTPGNAHTG